MAVILETNALNFVFFTYFCKKLNTTFLSSPSRFEHGGSIRSSKYMYQMFSIILTFRQFEHFCVWIRNSKLI